MPGPFAKFFRPEDAWLEDYLNADKSSEVAAQNQEPWAAPLRAPAQMPPVQYGTTTKDAQEELDKKTTGRKGVTLPQGEEGLAAHERLLEFVRRQPEIQEQRQGQAALRDLLRTEAGQAPMLDLGPLYDLANTWTGSKMGAGYMRPESAAARRDKILGYAEKLQDNQRDLATSVSTMLGRMIPTLPVETQQLVEALKSATSKTAAPIKGTGPKLEREDMAYEKIWTALKDDKAAGKSIAALQFAPIAEGELMRGTKVDIELLKRALLNMGGDTRPSDRDVGAFGGSSLIRDRAIQAWNWAFGSGRFTPKNKEEMGAILRGFRNLAAKRLRALVKGHVKSGLAGHRVLTDQKKLTDFIHGRLGYAAQEIDAWAGPEEPTFEEFKKLSPEEKKKVRR